MGADEFSATRLYRSVGKTATPLASGGGTNGLTISGSTATFTGALPNTIGVGDAIQYDSDGNASIDGLAFIHGRTNSQTYTVKNKSGAPPTPVAAYTGWTIYRAYIRLLNWQTQTENTNIDNLVENFDTSKDLVASNTIMSVACYADADDTNAVEVTLWITDANHYIDIFTPFLSSQVGVTQRHTGTWASGGYKLIASAQ